MLKCYECLNEQGVPDLCEKDGVTQNLNDCSAEVIGCTEDISEYASKLALFAHFVKLVNCTRV